MVVVLVALVLLATVVVLPGYGSACDGMPYPESLTVNITRQPVGGMNVGLVGCAFTATYVREFVSKEDDPKYHAANGVDLSVYFVNDRGSKYSEQSYKFDANGESTQTISKTITFQAPAGMYLDKTFWVVFSWSDHSRQKSHTLESAKAVCTVR
jgi:hypothetical protein